MICNNCQQKCIYFYMEDHRKKREKLETIKGRLELMTLCAKFIHELPGCQVKRERFLSVRKACRQTYPGTEIEIA